MTPLIPAQSAVGRRGPLSQPITPATKPSTGNLAQISWRHSLH